MRRDLPADEQLEQLAGRVAQLGLKRRDPESFHTEKSDIAAEIRRVARLLRGEVRVQPSTSWRPK